jgi:CheY-like chemotaxis protein
MVTGLLRPQTDGMDFDAASVDAGPGASIAEPLPARAQALPAETRSPSPRLPLAASAFADNTEGAVTRMVAAPSACDDQGSVHVLIVDDHPSFRASARALLEAEGFEVVGEAEDGASALRAVIELSPELVLLDVQLPDLDGFEVARRLTDGGGPAVVLVSSRDGSDFGPLVERSGARGFIPKAELSGAALSALLA